MEPQPQNITVRRHQQCRCLAPNPYTVPQGFLDLPENPKLVDRARQWRRRYISAIVQFPVSICLFLVLLQCIMVAIAFGGVLNTAEGAADGPGQVSALGEVEVRRDMALDAARRDDRLDSGLHRPQTQEFSDMLMVFEAKAGKDLWTREGMLELFDILAALRGENDKYGKEILGFDEFCLMEILGEDGDDGDDRDYECSPTISPVNYVLFPAVSLGINPYHGRVTRADVAALDDLEIKRRAWEKLDWATNPASAPEDIRSDARIFFLFFEKSIVDTFHNESTTPADIRGRFTQSLMYFGGPLNIRDEKGNQKYENTQDRREEQKEIFREWAIPSYFPVFKAIKDDTSFFSQFVWWEDVMGNQVILDYIDQDLVLTAVAGSVIFILLSVQSGTFIISAAGIGMLAWTYPCGLVLFHGVLGFQVSPTLNQLALFVLLGIGADNVLVLYSAFSQSFAEPEDVIKNPFLQLDYVLSRSLTTIGIANLTTCLAFALASVSPIPVIGAFGALSSLMVMALFFATVSYLLVVLEIWASLWNSHFSCCFARKTDPRQYFGDACYPNHRYTQTNANEPADEEADDDQQVLQEAEAPKQRLEDLDDVDVSGFRPIERFFYNYWASWIHFLRFPLVCLVPIIIGLGIYGTVHLSPPNRQTTPLPADSDLRLLLDSLLPKFAPVSQAWGGTRVSLTFGIDPDDPLDRTGLDPNDEFNLGKVNYEPLNVFPIHELGALRAAAEACDILLSYRFPKTSSTSQASGIIDIAAGGHPVACTPQAFLDWEAKQRDLNSSQELDANDWDFSPQSFALYLKHNYTKYLDDSDDPTDHRLADSWLGLSPTEPDRVRGLVITSNSTLPVDPDRKALTRHFQGWEEATSRVNKALASTPYKFRAFASEWFMSYFVTSEIMVKSTYESIAITFSVAVLCILLTSANYIITALVSINLLAVVLGAIALFVAQGNVLDWPESILLSVLPGLAIDASLHIAISFATSHAKTAFHRTRFALLELGVSVFMGGVTSIVPNAILWGAAAIPFFVLFGNVVSQSLLLSLVIAFSTLPATLMVFGPNADRGNIYSCCKRQKIPSQQPISNDQEPTIA